jgi:hypothetical protein
LNIFVHLFSGDLDLLLLIDCHLYSKIFNYLGASDSPDLSEVLTCKDLRLILVQPQDPIRSKLRQFIDDHLHFMLIVGHHEHVIREAQ